MINKEMKMAVYKGYIQYNDNKDLERYFAVAPDGKVLVSASWFRRPESNFYVMGRVFVEIKDFDPVAEGLVFCGNYDLPF